MIEFAQTSRVNVLVSTQLSKKYGPVFTVHLGPKKVVVLAGYKTVKTALVDHAEEFGERDISPLFYDFNKGHGELEELPLLLVSQCLVKLTRKEWSFPQAFYSAMVSAGKR